MQAEGDVYSRPKRISFNIFPSSANCIILDEKNLLQQAFDPLYVSEAEAEEAFKEMRSKLNAAIAKRNEGWSLIRIK